MRYYWAQVNAWGMASGRYFAVARHEELEDVVVRHFDSYKIVDAEEVTKEYAEKNQMRGILK